jgi:hypothetical protein
MLIGEEFFCEQSRNLVKKLACNVCFGTQFSQFYKKNKKIDVAKIACYRIVTSRIDISMLVLLVI